MTRRNARIRSVLLRGQSKQKKNFEIFPVFQCSLFTLLGYTTEVAGRPRTAAVSDGELHFQQELQDAQNEIKVSSQTVFRLVTERNFVSHTLEVDNVQIQIRVEIKASFVLNPVKTP